MTRTNVADSWIAETLLLMRHNPPNADSEESQISKLSPKSLYKEYSTWCRDEWHQKLQGVVAHGKALFLYNIFQGVKPGANMFLTTLLRTLQHLGQGLPRTVKLRIDGGLPRMECDDLCLCRLVL